MQAFEGQVFGSVTLMIHISPPTLPTIDSCSTGLCHHHLYTLIVILFFVLMIQEHLFHVLTFAQALLYIIFPPLHKGSNRLFHKHIYIYCSIHFHMLCATSLIPLQALYKWGINFISNTRYFFLLLVRLHLNTLTTIHTHRRYHACVSVYTGTQ